MLLNLIHWNFKQFTHKQVLYILCSLLYLILISANVFEMSVIAILLIRFHFLGSLLAVPSCQLCVWMICNLREIFCLRYWLIFIFLDASLPWTLDSCLSLHRMNIHLFSISAQWLLSTLLKCNTEKYTYSAIFSRRLDLLTVDIHLMTFESCSRKTSAEYRSQSAY